MNNIDSYKKSIREANFSSEDETTIWDFYVTKSLSRASSQHRILSDYYEPDFRSPLNLLNRMLIIANIKDAECKIFHGTTLKKCLEQLNLSPDEDNDFNIAVPKIACLIPCTRDEHYSEKKCVISIMIHARNAFAHGNTYFFDNDFIMLEDLGFNKEITARMLFHKSTLLSWIKLFDRKKKYYPEFNR